MSHLQHSDWQSSYQEAVTTLNPAELANRIHKAEMAIFLRVQELPISSEGNVEGRAIFEALQNLRSLGVNSLVLAGRRGYESRETAPAQMKIGDYAEKRRAGISRDRGATAARGRLKTDVRLRLKIEPPVEVNPPSKQVRGRILFLGNSYNPLSIACLQGILESRYETIVGIYDPAAQGPWKLLRKNLKTRGASLVLQKAADLTRSKARMALRQMGVPLSGFGSLPELTRSRRLEVIRCTDPNDAEFLDEVRKLGVDLIVVAAFSRVLKKALISIPQAGCINVHPSLLPRYRGPEPFYWVLANGESKTGVTIHYVNEQIDSGDIILQRDLAVYPDETRATLANRSADMATELLREAIPALLAGTAPRTPQDSSSASYYSFPPKGVSIRKARARARGSYIELVRRYARRLYTIDPLQDTRWASFLEEHPQASVFHSIPWLQTLRRTYGFEPVVYTTSKPGAPLSNGVVFCRVKSWITGRRLVSLPFSDHCEPLVDSAREFESILGYLQSDRAAGNCKYVEIRPSTAKLSDTISSGAFRPSKQYFLHTIDLRAEEEQLMQRFHKNSVQQSIRRAEREGVAYECGQSNVLLKKFYDLMLLARRRHHVPPQPGEWFRILRDSMGDALRIHLASYRGKAVAAVLTLRFKNTVVYKYGGSDQAYHRLGSVPYLLSKAIRYAKSHGAQVFDLGRSDCDNRGLIEFKNHWGSSRTLMTCWRFPGPPPEVTKTDSRALRMAKQIFEFLPDSLLKLAGETLYRHVG